MWYNLWFGFIFFQRWWASLLKVLFYFWRTYQHVHAIDYIHVCLCRFCTASHVRNFKTYSARKRHPTWGTNIIQLRFFTMQVHVKVIFLNSFRKGKPKSSASFKFRIEFCVFGVATWNRSTFHRFEDSLKLLLRWHLKDEADHFRCILNKNIERSSHSTWQIGTNRAFVELDNAADVVIEAKNKL